ncbi:unnamed protein product [Rangifer tarandus platyrhynchus]|uniref:Uncharacterized protein n=2 Tax=Rangifer tarandus platyrhynchus TaxID=3082113 RepID=A0AC59YHE7_RANTA|nr:unnamed protein product [Rangifer tarandus platyrhynchus]
MLHNRPHSGQEGSPGLLPATRRGPMGPGAEGNPLPPPTTCFPLPPWGTPGWALAHSQIPRRRGGMGFRCFLTGNWRQTHVPLGALPRKGARDRTPVLATAAVRHHTALTSLQSLDNSGQSCGCRALQCHKAGH